MKIIDNCCDSCLHKKVCKNTPSAKTLVEIIKNTVADKNDKLNFTIKIICDDYFGNVATEGKDNETNRLDITTLDVLPYTYKIKDSASSCEGCPTHEMLKNLNRPYLGDLPCQWCNRNSYKLVCGLATSNPCENKTITKTPNYKNSCVSNTTETNIMD